MTAPKPRKNVLLIVVDQWRGDMLPALGATGLRMPNIERLCREGASVIIAEIDQALGSEAEASLKARGFDARFIQVDVSSEASVEKMADALQLAEGSAEMMAGDVLLHGMIDS